MNEKLQTDGALLRGAVIPVKNVITGEMLCDFPENQERLILLSRNYRLRRHSDGWFVDGRGHTSQIWEFGIGKLGVTIVTRYMERFMHLDWLTPTQVGDGEANFRCDWTDDNLKRLEDLIHLQKRKLYHDVEEGEDGEGRAQDDSTTQTTI